jgi:hypothetical protein
MGAQGRFSVGPVIKSTRPRWLTEHKFSVLISSAEQPGAEFPDSKRSIE